MEFNVFRWVLPKKCTDFASKEGKLIFKEALESGCLNIFFEIGPQIVNQEDINLCGLSSLVMILNGFKVDPGRVWKGIWRWYDERMVRSCNLDEIQKEGVTMDQLAAIARCNQLNADVVYVDEHTSIDDFRRVVENTCKGNSSAVICSFGKSYLGTLGVGQFATIAGYHAKRGLVLALEPARYKHRIFWTPLESLWGAMVATDKATDPTIDIQRGYMVLSQAKPLKK